MIGCVRVSKIFPSEIGKIYLNWTTTDNDSRYRMCYQTSYIQLGQWHSLVNEWMLTDRDKSKNHKTFLWYRFSERFSNSMHQTCLSCCCFFFVQTYQSWLFHLRYLCLIPNKRSCSIGCNKLENEYVKGGVALFVRTAHSLHDTIRE